MSKREAAEAAQEPVTVVPVEGRKAWRDFHHLPFSIYADDPHWVPPLLLERQTHFDPRHNPFFRHAKAGFWLAYRGQTPVGRITAQVDALHLKQHNDATGHFGFIEGFDDSAVFAALLDAAERWIASQGMERSVGPISFCMWDEPGLLVDGFERPPNVLMGHARPYYQDRVAACGYSKLQDLLAYEYDLRQPFSADMQRRIARIKQKHEFTFRPMRMDRKNFPSEIALMLDIVNDAWADNWGYVPMTQAEIDDMASVFKFLLPPDAAVIAEFDGEAAGFGLMMPNLNEIIRDLNGRLFPFGFLKLLWRLKVVGVRTGRMPLMGVRRKWRNSPIGAIIALLIVHNARISKFASPGETAELSWILDSNERMKGMLNALGAAVIKRYRIYEKALA